MTTTTPGQSQPQHWSAYLVYYAVDTPIVSDLGRLFFTPCSIANGRHPLCLGRTKHNEPRHPLFVRRDAPLEQLPWP
jgi:hypothetical protein